MNSMLISKRIWTLGVLFAVFAAFAMASSSIAGKVGYYQDAGDVKYVSTPDDGVQLKGVACQDAVGNVYVGWIENDQVYAQKMAASDNSRQWGTNGLVALNDVQLSDPIAIDLTFDGTYLWVAVLDRTAEGDDVLVQRIASNGALFWASPLRKVVNDKPEDPDDIDDCVRIAADGLGGVVVAVPGFHDSVYIRRVETGGSFTYDMIATLLPANNGYLKLLRGNAGKVWVASANATDIYVKYYDEGGAGSSELTGGAWNWNGGSEFWTVASGSGGIVAVADNGDGDTKIYGLDSSGGLYTETTVNGTAPTAATALEAGAQYVAFLTDNKNVHKYAIDTGDFDKDADFPVDLGTIPHGDVVTVNPQMGDLGGECIGISGYVTGAGNDLYVQVLSEDGVTFYNDVDDPTPVDANGTLEEVIIENLALFSGSGKAVVLFDDCDDDEGACGDYDDGDTNVDDADTYLVAPFDFGEAADLRWTAGIAANPDVLDTADANSTLTVNAGVVENAGQVDAEDVKVWFYIANTNEIADANTWNNEIVVKKLKVDEQDIGDLDTGGNYDYETSNYDVNIDQATVNQILLDLGPDVYLCALVNGGEIINEESYFVISTNVTEFPATNLSCTSALKVHAPDFVPDTIDVDVPDVAAGDNVTLDEVEIRNDGDSEGTCNVGFFLSTDGDLNGTVDVLDGAVFLGNVDGVTIPAGGTVTLDPVELVIPYNTATVYIYVAPDYENTVGELDEDNNVDKSAGVGHTNGFNVTGLPDLTVPILASTEAEVTAASSGGFNVAKVAGVDPGEVIPVRFTVMNEGAVPSGITKVKAYFTDNATNLDPDDMFYVDMLPALYPEWWWDLEFDPFFPTFVTFNTEVTVPEDAAGEYYIVVVADPEDLVKEFDEDNNSAQKTIIVDLLVPSIDAVYGSGVVSLDLDLDVAGDYEGQPADFWLAVWAGPFGQMYYYQLATSAWYSTPVPFMQEDLASMAGTIEFPMVLPAGTYVFYFGVDDQNGAVDPDVLFDFDTLFVR